jgi:ATP:ADP antiporter, AAA family
VIDGRLSRWLSKLGDVRGREARAALTLFGYFFLITFAFYIIKPIREGLLIGAHPAWWPYADLATALLIGFVVALNTRLLERLPRRTYLTASLLFFVASLFAFWYIFDIIQKVRVQTPVADSSGVLFLLWAQTLILKHKVIPVFAFCFWADVFIAMSVTQFWIAVNDVIAPYQAKRLIGLFVSGGLFGGIAGSAVAALAGRFSHFRTSPQDLLLVCPALLVLALVMVNLVYAGQRQADPVAGTERLAPAARVGYLESFRTVLRHRYLLLLAAMIASALVTATLVNYQFKTIVRHFYETDADRTSFVAAFLFVILAVSTIVHLFTTRRFLRTYGIGWAISLAPAVLLVGAAAVFALPVGLLLAWAWYERGGDKAFDSTLSQSVRELLYIPVPEELKFKAKIFIDMFVNKFATGFGAALYLVLLHWRHFAYREDQPLAIVRETGVLTLIFVLTWLALTRLVYRQYPDVLKPAIRRKWEMGDAVIASHVDVDWTLKIFNTIQSRERSTTLYLMNVFDLVHRKELTPELKDLLGIKRDALTAQGMDTLFDVGGARLFPGLEEAMEDTEFRQEIDLVFLLPTYQEIMAGQLSRIVASPSEVDRIEAAKIIGRMVANPPTLEALGNLLADPSAEVAAYALESAAVHRHPEHVTLIVERLGNPMLRGEAQTALAAYGMGIEAMLQPVLHDVEIAPEVRRAVPEVLARLGTQRAADILLDELGRHEDTLEQALVEALDKVRAERPDVRFREKTVRAEVLHFIRRCGNLVLDPPADPAEARAALTIRIKRVFDLLTLLYPREDIVKAYQNILQGTARSAAYSLEHLDTFLDRDIKALLMPLLEDLPDEERAVRVRKALRLK